MKLPFLRKSPAAEPLVVSMTGVRLGERVVYLGSSLQLLLDLARRTGLSGRVIVLAGAQRAGSLEQAAAREGVLVEAPEEMPADALGACDLAVFDVSAGEEASDGRRAALGRLAAALRPGGRLVAIERGTPQGLARLAGRGEAAPSTLPADLDAAGLSKVREIGDRGGLRFFEAVKAGG